MIRDPKDDYKDSTVWYARGGGIKKCGPFKTQIEAIDAMRIAGRVDEFPVNVFVWPEETN